MLMRTFFAVLAAVAMLGATGSAAHASETGSATCPALVCCYPINTPVFKDTPCLPIP